MANLSDLTSTLKLNGAQFLTTITGAIAAMEGLTSAVAAQMPAIQKTSSGIDAYLSKLERQAKLAGKTTVEQLKLQKQFDMADAKKASSSVIDLANSYMRLNDVYDVLIAKAQATADAASRVDQALQAIKGHKDYVQSLNDMAGSALRLGLALGTAITTPIVGLATKALQLGSSFQQAEVGFTTMLGSAEKATDFLSSLKDFAAKTPFEFPELLQASKRMQALGFSAENTIPILRTVGDSVAGLGGGAELINRITLALGQMQAKGKVSAEEMRQLAEAGIPAWQALATSIGKSVPEAMKMAEAGTLSAAQAIPAILEGMNSKFAGLMDAQAKTIVGQWSNLKDRLTFILADIGKVLIPFAQSIVVVLDPVVAGIGKLVSAFATAPAFVQAFVIGLAGVLAALGPLALAFAGFAATLSPIAMALGTTGIGATLGALIPILGQVAVVLGVVAAAFAILQLPAVQGAFQALGRVMKEFWQTTLEPIVSRVIALGKAFADAASNIISSGLTQAYDAIASATKAVWEWLGKVWDQLRIFGSAVVEVVRTLGPFGEAILYVWDSLGKLLAILVSGGILATLGLLKGAFQVVVGVVEVLATVLGTVLLTALTGIAAGAKAMAGVFSAVVTPVLNLATAAVVKFLDFILALPGVGSALKAVGVVFEDLRNKVTGYTESLRGAADNYQGFNSATRTLGQELSNAQKNVDATKASLDALKVGFKGTGEELDAIKQASRAYADAQAALTRVQGSAKQQLGLHQKALKELGSEMATAKVQVDKLNAASAAGTITYDKVVEAQKRLTEASGAYQEEQTRVKDLTSLVGAENNRYSGTLADVRASMQANQTHAKSLGDQHKEQGEAVKQAKLQYDDLFRKFNEGLVPLAAVEAAWSKLQKLQATLHPEVVTAALDQQAKDAAKAAQENEAVFEKFQRVTMESDHVLSQLAQTFAKAEAKIKETTPEVSRLKQAFDQSKNTYRDAALRVTELTKRYSEGEDVAYELAVAQANLEEATRDLSTTSKAYAKDLQSSGLPEKYEKQVEALRELNKAMKDLGGISLNSLVLSLASAEAALRNLNELESKGVAVSPYEKLQAEVEVADRKLAIRRANGKDIEQADIDHLNNLKDNLERFKGPYLSTMDQIFKHSGASGGSFSTLVTNARKAKEALEAMEQEIADGVKVAEYDKLQIRKQALETHIALVQATTGKVMAEDRKQLEAIQKNLDKLTGAHRSAWGRILADVKGLMNALGNEFARGFANLFKDLVFGSELNKQLEQQANDLRGSLDERAQEWAKYVVEVNTQLEAITTTHARELAQELADLDASLVERTGAHQEYVDEVNSKIEDIRAKHAQELTQETADLWEAFHEKLSAFQNYEQEVQAQQAKLTEDAARQLDRQLDDLHENLRDRVESYDDFVRQSNKTLSRLGEDAAESLTEQQQKTNEKRADLQQDYARDVEDLEADLADALKKKDTKRVTEIRLALKRRNEDYQKAMARLTADDSAAVADIKQRAERQTQDIKEDLATRARDHQQYLEEVAEDEQQLVSDNGRRLAEQLGDLETNLEERRKALDGFWAKLQTDLAEATASHGREEAAQVISLQASLAKRVADYDQFVLDTNARAEAITAKHATEVEAETAKVKGEFGKRLLDYDQFNLDVQTKLDDLKKRHQDTLDLIGGLFKDLGAKAAEGFLQITGQAIWDNIADLLKARWGKVLSGMLDQLGEWVKDAGKAIAGVGSDVAGGVVSAGGKAAEAPMPIPGGGGGSAGGVGGGAAQAAGGGLSGWISAISGAVTAISSVITNFQQAHMTTLLGRIEESTRYAKDYLLQVVERGINLFLAELPLLRSEFGQFLDQHAWRIHDVWERLGIINTSLGDIHATLKKMVTGKGATPSESPKQAKVYSASSPTPFIVNPSLVDPVLPAPNVDVRVEAPEQATLLTMLSTALMQLETSMAQRLEALLQQVTLSNFLLTAIGKMVPSPEATQVTNVVNSQLNHEVLVPWFARVQAWMTANPVVDTLKKVFSSPTFISTPTADVNVDVGGVNSIGPLDGLLAAIAQLEMSLTKRLGNLLQQVIQSNFLLEAIGKIAPAPASPLVFSPPVVNVAETPNDTGWKKVATPGDTSSPTLLGQLLEATFRLGDLLEYGFNRLFAAVVGAGGVVNTLVALTDFLGQSNQLSYEAMVPWFAGAQAWMAANPVSDTLQRLLGADTQSAPIQNTVIAALDTRWVDTLAQLRNLEFQATISNGYLEKLVTLQSVLPGNNSQGKSQLTVNNNTTLKVDSRVLANAVVQNIQNMGVRG